MIRQRMSQEAWDVFFSRVREGVNFSEDFICVSESVFYGAGLAKLGPEGLSSSFRDADPGLVDAGSTLELDWLADEGQVEGVDEGAVTSESAVKAPPQLRLRFQNVGTPHMVIEISDKEAPMLDMWRMCIILMKRFGIKV